METDGHRGQDDVLLDRAGKALFRFGRVFARLPRRDLLQAPTGWDVELSAILLVQAIEAIEAEGLAATVGGLAGKLGVDPSTASRLVAQAVRAGYLRRVALQRDGRAVGLALTEAGRELGAGAARYQRAVFDAATQGWTNDERVAFARLFVRFATGVVAMMTEMSDAGTGVGAEPHEAGWPPPPPTPASGRPAADPAEAQRAVGPRKEGAEMNPDAPEVAVVTAWHEALNAGDADRVAALSHDAVELVGPRGVACGRAVVRDWAGRAGAQLEPLRWFHRDGSVVVEQRATWRAGETAAANAPLVVATAFRVRDGLVLQIARHDGVREALAAAGLDESAAVPRS